MKLCTIVSLAMMLSSQLCLGQASGSIGYAQGTGAARATQNERSKRALARDEMPPSPTSTLLDASVLMNVKADEYVAVFGVAQEGSTVAECGQKMDATIGTLMGAFEGLGVARKDLFVDFVAQNKIYGYDVTDQIARERLTGFELKKNLIVHYRDYTLLDKLVLAASQAQVYDLIKVDYVLKDTAAVQARLMEEAARVLKRKAALYQQLMGIRLGPPVQVLADRPSIYYPSEMYDSYVAAESESVNAGFDRQRYIVQGARKSRTFVFNALGASGFDAVVNPVVIEPVVQCTLYVKARCEAIQPTRRGPASTAHGGRAPRGR